MSQISGQASSGAANPIETLTGNSGGAVGPTLGNINIVGSGGVSVAGNPGTSTLTITVGGSFTWTEVAGTSATMASNNGYIPQNAGLTTLTLPAVASVGDIIEVAGKGSGGWTVAQNAGQTIKFLSGATTVGAGGSLASTTQYDSLKILCITANTTFSVLRAGGNLTIV